MRFLVDECTGPAVARWLREQNHEVFSVYEEARGIEDDGIIQKAFDEDWILITNDKDFGELVYRERRPHKGVVLLRLEDERANNKIDAIRRLLRDYTERLPHHFVVVTETRVRFARSGERGSCVPRPADRVILRDANGSARNSVGSVTRWFTPHPSGG